MGCHRPVYTDIALSHCSWTHSVRLLRNIVKCWERALGTTSFPFRYLGVIVGSFDFQSVTALVCLRERKLIPGGHRLFHPDPYECQDYPFAAGSDFCSKAVFAKMFCGKFPLDFIYIQEVVKSRLDYLHWFLRLPWTLRYLRRAGFEGDH